MDFMKFDIIKFFWIHKKKYLTVKPLHYSISNVHILAANFYEFQPSWPSSKRPKTKGSKISVF